MIDLPQLMNILKKDMTIFNEPLKSLYHENELTFDIFKSLVASYKKDLEYNNFLKSKRVVLVGPSPSLDNSGKGKFIDSFDIVVRLNKGYPVKGEVTTDIGSRTDIHYHCFHESEKCGGKIHYDLMERDNIYVCCPYPKYVNPFHKDIVRFEQNKKDLRFHSIDTNLYLECARKMATRPNSGIGAILDILSHDILELYVTGFTFFKDGWRKTYKSESIMESGWKEKQFNGTHAQKPQMDAIRNLTQDPRLKLDDVMKGILNI